MGLLFESQGAGEGLLFESQGAGEGLLFESQGAGGPCVSGSGNDE
jgi:hypothetical protein